MYCRTTTFLVAQQLIGSKHIAADVRVKDRPCRQSLLASSATTFSSEPSEFSTYAKDVCKAFVFSDIPLFEINNFEVRNLLLKYTQTDSPEESSLRKISVPECYKETSIKIRVLCWKENIWVSIHEVTDGSGVKFANVINIVKKDQTYKRNHLFCHARKFLQ